MTRIRDRLLVAHVFGHEVVEPAVLNGLPKHSVHDCPIYQLHGAPSMCSWKMLVDEDIVGKSFCSGLNDALSKY